MIRSAHHNAIALFQTPAKLIAERFGTHNLLAFGTAYAELAFIALDQTADFAAILLALFCTDFDSAFQHPLCSTLISHTYPNNGRHATLSTYNFFDNVGKFAFDNTISLLFIANIP